MKFNLPEQDLREDFIRPANGPGGQHLNKTSNAVRLYFRFKESGAIPASVKERLPLIAPSLIVGDELVICAKESRSLQQNRERARIRLHALLEAAAVIPKTRRPTKPGKAAKERRLNEKSKRGALKQTRSQRHFHED